MDGEPPPPAADLGRELADRHERADGVGSEVARAASRVHIEAADALDGAKIDAWEAKENYKLFEEGVKRQEDLVRQERKERTNREEKWRQIELGLFLMNSRYAPDDPKRWEPDEWEYGELYDRPGSLTGSRSVNKVPMWCE